MDDVANAPLWFPFKQILANHTGPLIGEPVDLEDGMVSDDLTTCLLSRVYQAPYLAGGGMGALCSDNVANIS